MPGARLAAAIGALVLTGALVAVPAAGARGKKARTVPNRGVVKLGMVRCAGAEACAVKPTPTRVAARVAGKKVKARVLVPRALGRDGRAAVKLRFGRGARERLAGHAATFRARVVVRGSGERTVKRFQVRLRRPAARSAAPGRTGVGGNGGPSGAPHSEPVSGEPPPLTRPLTAVTVEGVSLEWFPRASWVAYVASGEGTSAGGGATAVVSASPPCPARPGSAEGSLVPAASLPYEIDFGGAASWYDPASGTAAINGAGSVSFRYRGHGINLTGSEPEVQIAGAASRAIFRFSGSEGTPYPNQRVALLGLDTTGAPTIGDNAGKTTYSYDLLRARLTPDGEKVFAGFYPAPEDNGFGCLSATFTLP